MPTDSHKLKLAKMAVLHGLINKPTAEAVSPIGGLGKLKNYERSAMEEAIKKKPKK